MESLCEMKQLDLATFLAQSDMTGNKLTQTARIDVGDPCEVKDDLISTFINQTVERLLKCDIGSADPYVAVHVQNRHVADSTLMDVKSVHICSPYLQSEEVFTNDRFGAPDCWSAMFPGGIGGGDWSALSQSE